jgi:hypothetical protein
VLAAMMGISVGQACPRSKLLYNLSSKGNGEVVGHGSIANKNNLHLIQVYVAEFLTAFEVVSSKISC